MNWLGHSTLSVREAGWVLGISPDSVRKLQAKGALSRIPHVRSNRIPKVSIDRLLEGATNETGRVRS